MKSKTDDLRIINTQELVSPQEIIDTISPSEKGFATIVKARNQIKNILNKFTNDLDIKGIILIAPEGLNFSISICSSQYNIYIKRLNTLFKLLYDDLKISYSNKHILFSAKLLEVDILRHLDIFCLRCKKRLAHLILF